jgi:ABC-type multidrug transport system ATPase subunit
MDVSTQGLTKIYGRRVKALDGVDLTMPTGMFGLLGPNGAGKTTLMRILAGVLRPTSGEVWAGGYDLTSESGRREVKRVLGYLPQDLGLYPDLSAAEFLDYVGILKEMRDKRARKERVAELLEIVGLSEVSGRKLGGFSGGMKRRVGIAQALLNDPRLLIVDEPTAGLDPEERIRFRNLLSDLAGDRTVLLSTHIVEDVAQTCRKVAVLSKGRVLFSGTADGLVDAARGRVYTVEAASSLRPEGQSMAVVSTLHLGSSVRYRVVGEPPADLAGEPAEPGLEDGYVWLMLAGGAKEVATSG